MGEPGPTNLLVYVDRWVGRPALWQVISDMFVIAAAAVCLKEGPEDVVVGYVRNEHGTLGNWSQFISGSQDPKDTTNVLVYNDHGYE